ncbi:TonB-dependent receptor [Phenylobacterium montanum]|uniref:TonB-dependent receptor n=1 Tax=Phenylobacterium montanum TaxID=2823693 RepID=A0A975G2P4_9CAUL|nr:TonB-dependent receptor [Caulobacter sp. S6]QUD89785.1 TonB-dependent receptor [Caulobacter sp. S6]
MGHQPTVRACLLVGSSAVALALSAGPALAQQSKTAPGPSAVTEVVVTAQRRQEMAQHVPIAISAFSAKTLQAEKIEGGPDLLKAVPNVSFTKTNFAGYNLTIRGIGTQAISVATDPGVSVNFNSTALIRNRLFEQEFFDIERVEVLRGPQGTLYGRNATAGAVNVISAKPTGVFEGDIKGEVGNYDTRRISGFLNIPVIGDKLDLRIAGASTSRSGFAENTTTGDKIDGRDLYSTRVTIGFKPTEHLRADLIWEHFNENDSRARSTKQLCTRDPGLTSLGSIQDLSPLAGAFFSQGCKDASLYSPTAYGTPNGLSIPFVLAGAQNTQFLGYDPNTFNAVQLLKVMDPYGGQMQSPDLRKIASLFDPRYRAKADVIELNADFDLTPHLTLTSQTAFDEDRYFSTEDYNRFNTVPGVFNDSTGLLNAISSGAAPNITPGGVYCDPQLGCSNTIVGLDMSRATSRQFSQELRLQSSFAGPFNFSVGGNYVTYKTVEDYFVFFNVISAIAQSTGPVGNNNAAYNFCDDGNGPPRPVTPNGTSGCIYIDPNKLSKINGLGHNYFRSENPYKLSSAAAFGELYYKLTPDLKLTAGLRYTADTKTFTPVPSQVLLSSANGGTVDGGYPVSPDIKQSWGAVTGRFGIDWQPKLSFTNQTLVYAFYNRGYKAGGANPPPIGYSSQSSIPGLPPTVQLLSYPTTFKPEYVNAFEVGTKNALMGGTLIVNANAFYYDYSGYQVSQIEDRTAINENFNTKIWGAELESVWQATHNLRFNLALGYQHSQLAKGSRSIDVENRTQGNPAYVTMKGNEFLPSNCVVSKSFVESILAYNRANGLTDDANLAAICPGTIFSLGLPFQPAASDFPNGGRGFYADLTGHSLPNAPNFTQSLGAEYTREVGGGWIATLRGDVYHQSQSWARVYQDPIDKLHGWYNVNLRLTVAKPDAGLEMEVYVKNLLDDTPITGAFINSDDTALTTNVFTLDPRLIGFSVSKKF